MPLTGFRRSFYSFSTDACAWEPDTRRRSMVGTPTEPTTLAPMHLRVSNFVHTRLRARMHIPVVPWYLGYKCGGRESSMMGDQKYKLFIPTRITMLCIEQRPPPSATIQCFHCHADCPPGKRRRDPYGTWYCNRCGWKIQTLVRDAVQNNPGLAYFVVAIPGFLRYCRPDTIGLGRFYDGVDFQYQPPPPAFPKHKPRPPGVPSDCFGCRKTIPYGASNSRRGVDPNAIYCAPCGLAMRRAAARITRADALLVKMYRLVPNVGRFLRHDVLTWLDGDDLLDNIIQQG